MADQQNQDIAKINIFVIFGSLLLSPVVLFISTISDLYINNQMDLGYSYQVLYPFLWLFVVTVAIGFLLYRFSGYRIFRYMLLFYYGIGSFFIFYEPLRIISVPLVETAIGFTILIVLFLGSFIFIAGKVKLKSMVSLFAILGLFSLLFEGYSFYSGFQPPPPNHTDVNYTQSQIDVGTKKLPNIYLFILDAYQTDMFNLTVTPEVKKSLGGFVHFNENTALFGRTLMSIPSIFGGKSYDFNGSQVDYKENSFISSSSILAWLKKAGYAEYAFLINKIQEYNNLSLFDFVIEHESKRGDYTPHSAFFGLWAYRNLPLFMSTIILGQERIERILNVGTLPRNANVSSYNGFLRYLENEKSLSASNRFTFLYVLIPHEPYIFNEDCSFSTDMKETGPLSQSRCATSMIIKFIENLKELNRFKDSMIVITADHGLPYKVEGEELKSVGGSRAEVHEAVSRALLLVKPAGVASDDKFLVNKFQSSLLDIAPTIAASLPVAPQVNFEGVSLTELELPLKARKKYYYYYDKKGGFGWTDEMSRFVIENNRIREDGVVKIENNGPQSIIYNNNGNFLLNQGKTGEAIKEFRKAISSDPGFDRAKINLANALTINGQYDEAITLYKTLLAKDPLNPKTLVNLGINYALQGKFEMAVENFELSIELNAFDSNAFYNYALALVELNRIEEAVEAYMKVAELSPMDFKSRNNLANIFMQKNNLKRAEAMYIEVLGIQPAFPQALNNLGIIMNINKRNPESLSYYKRALKADPGYVDAYYNMGITFEDLGRWSEAIECYKNAIKIIPKYADAHHSLANIYMKENLYVEALNEFRVLLKINSQDKKAVIGLEKALRLTEGIK